MHFPTTQALSILLFSGAALASGSQVGYTGRLSSLDGGLGGIVTVESSSTLLITEYTLADASAPELYWWGSQSEQLSAGFRISNMHITMPASSSNVTINLDAGKTPADFSVVGLWCEQFKTNFGQADLKAAAGGSNSPSGTGSADSSAATTGAAATQSGSKGSAGSVNTVGPTFAALAGIVGFTLAMW